MGYGRCCLAGLLLLLSNSATTTTRPSVRPRISLLCFSSWLSLSLSWWLIPWSLLKKRGRRRRTLLSTIWTFETKSTIQNTEHNNNNNNNNNNSSSQQQQIRSLYGQEEEEEEWPTSPGRTYIPFFFLVGVEYILDDDETTETVVRRANERRAELRRDPSWPYTHLLFTSQFFVLFCSTKPPTHTRSFEACLSWSTPFFSFHGGIH
jgi:hypothetical protein